MQPEVAHTALGRKNYLFLGSDNGGTAEAVLYSFLASAKKLVGAGRGSGAARCYKLENLRFE